jgi:uncharacterized protein
LVSRPEATILVQDFPVSSLLRRSESDKRSFVMVFMKFSQMLLIPKNVESDAIGGIEVRVSRVKELVQLVVQTDGVILDGRGGMLSQIPPYHFLRSIAEPPMKAFGIGIGNMMYPWHRKAGRTCRRVGALHETRHSRRPSSHIRSVTGWYIDSTFVIQENVLP